MRGGTLAEAGGRASTLAALPLRLDRPQAGSLPKRRQRVGAAVRWQMLRFEDALLGLKLEAGGTIEEPGLRLSVWAPDAHDPGFYDRLTTEIEYRYNLQLRSRGLLQPLRSRSAARPCDRPLARHETRPRGIAIRVPGHRNRPPERDSEADGADDAGAARALRDAALIRRVGALRVLPTGDLGRSFGGGVARPQGRLPRALNPARERGSRTRGA
jgi:hypothetical protein